MTLLENEWRAGHGTDIMYLPVGERDYDWQMVPVSMKDNVLEIIRRKDRMREEVGIDLVWQATCVGGTFRATTGTHRLTMSVDINRRKLPNTGGLTDVTWYLERLIVPLIGAGYFIEFVAFTDSTVG